MNKLVQVQVLKIIELYQQGSTSTKIAQMFGVSRKTILKVLEKNGINLRFFINLPDKKTEIIPLKKGNILSVNLPVYNMFPNFNLGAEQIQNFMS